MRVTSKVTKLRPLIAALAIAMAASLELTTLSAALAEPSVTVSSAYPKVAPTAATKKIKKVSKNGRKSGRKNATGRAGRRSQNAASGVTGSAKAEVKSTELRQTPFDFVDDRVSRILRDLKGRPPRARVAAGGVTVGLPMWTTKTQWLNGVYSRALVDSSRATGLLSDKLLMFEVAKRELGNNSDRFLVRTVGLRDFLVREGLVGDDGRLVADGDKIESSLFKAFPSGFVVRPAVGVAPRETGKGLFADTDEFVAELLKSDTFLYRPDHRRKPVRSTVLDEIASGEAVVLQEDVVTQYGSNHGLTLKGDRAWREVRVHTYEGRVVADARPNFWVRNDKVTEAEITNANRFVSEFLALLPAGLLSRQAWSIDVLVLSDADGKSPPEMKISDIVTNRGRRGGWSGYLDQPRVLGAYTRHFETYAGVKFGGFAGYLLRKNAGNYFAYWGLRIEKSRPGLEKVLAWIPPWP